jgi:hypothetical protein
MDSWGCAVAVVHGLFLWGRCAAAAAGRARSRDADLIRGHPGVYPAGDGLAAGVACPGSGGGPLTGRLDERARRDHIEPGDDLCQRVFGERAGLVGAQDWWARR